MSQHSSSPPSLHTRQNSMWSSSSSPAASSSSSSSSLASHWIPSFSWRGGNTHTHTPGQGFESLLSDFARPAGLAVCCVFLVVEIRLLLRCLFVEACINILGRREQKAARSQLCCVLVFTVTQDVCEKFQTLRSSSRTRHVTNGTTKEPEAKHFFVCMCACKNSNSIAMCVFSQPWTYDV